MENKCLDCKNLGESVYMVLEEETLYNYWCKANSADHKNCDKFIEKDSVSEK